MLTATTATSDTTGSTSLTASAPNLGQEDFLRMLIAQLENQDPLNPQESTEFTAQLAQFSSLEQEIAMRESLGDISAGLARADNVTAMGLIGEDVLIESQLLELGEDGGSMLIELAGPATSGIADVYNEDGDVVAKINLGERPGGMSELTWDGLNDAGELLPSGLYAISVEALAGTNPVDSRTLLRGQVSGVDVGGSTPLLFLGELVAPLSSVREVGQGMKPEPLP